MKNTWNQIEEQLSEMGQHTEEKAEELTLSNDETTLSTDAEAPPKTCKIVQLSEYVRGGYNNR